MTPEERAEAVFASLERQGIPPFDDTYWMNPEDREAIVGPIADAIREAVQEALLAHARR